MYISAPATAEKPSELSQGIVQYLSIGTSVADNFNFKLKLASSIVSTSSAVVNEYFCSQLIVCDDSYSNAPLSLSFLIVAVSEVVSLPPS